MGRLRRSLGIAAAFGVAIIVAGGVFAALQERWSLFAIAGLLLTVGLLLNLHRKVGNAARSSSRERTQTAKRLQTELGAMPDRVSAAVAATLADEGAAISGRLLQDLGGISAQVDELSGAVVALEVSVDRLRSSADYGFTQVWSCFAEVDSRLYRLQHEPITELDAMHQLRERVQLTGRRPTVWGWALSPRGLLQLVDRVERHAPRVVVECGSGLSSIYLGTMLRDIEGGRVVSLEHEEQYAAETRRLVKERGLDDVVEILDVRLRDVEIRGIVYSWYDIDQLKEVEDVDLLLVDGPPKATGEQARYPALPMLADQLAPGAVVIMDDTHRTEEELIVKRWLEEYPLLRSDASITPYQSVLLWNSEERAY